MYRSWKIHQAQSGLRDPAPSSAPSKFFVNYVVALARWRRWVQLIIIIFFFILGATSRGTMTTRCACGCHPFSFHYITVLGGWWWWTCAHCCRHFLYIKCHLHQGDNNNECTFIIVVIFKISSATSTMGMMMMFCISSATSTKETITMSAHS